MKATRSELRQAGQALAVLTILVAAASAQAPSMARPRRKVLISIADRKLAVLQDGSVLMTFPIAVGASVSPSPAGEFQVINRVANPGYYHPGIIIPPGKNNPLGPRWIGLNKKGYGIHGTNEPQSIGRAASHGCIRLSNRDIQELFAIVSVGDIVEIHGQSDQETGEIFRASTGNPAGDILIANASTPGGAH